MALLDDLTVLDGLKACEGEVDHIFDHPLEALLDPELARKEKLVPRGSEHWPYEEELHVRSRLLGSSICMGAHKIFVCMQNTSDNQVSWLGVYRMHRFRSTASPVKGLTTDILVRPSSRCLNISVTFSGTRC